MIASFRSTPKKPGVVNSTDTVKTVTDFMDPHCLLSKYFALGIWITVLEYIILEILLFNYGPSICHDESYVRESWTRDVNMFISGSFTLDVLLHILRIMAGVVYSEHRNIRSTFYSALIVNMIAAFSSLTTLTISQGTCVDGYGVNTSVETWPEWLTSVPLLAFMAMSVDTKAEYDTRDYIFLIALFITILSGALMQLVASSMMLTNILLLSSCVSFTWAMRIASKMIEESKIICRPQLSSLNSAKSIFRIHIATRKIMLLRSLLVLLPVFPIIYFLTLFQVINNNHRDAGLMVASAAAKMLFASICTDARLEITHPSIYMLDMQEKASLERRAFLRYIFHEIRVPLNSISLGIQYLSDFKSNQTPDKVNVLSQSSSSQNSSNNTNSNISNNQQRQQLQDEEADDEENMLESETLNMMSEATNFMGDILNDVLAIQKIEEGILKLILKPFTLDSLLIVCLEPFHSAIELKKLSVSTQIDPSIPLLVRGDKYRLNHVLTKILSNAVRFSPNGSGISVTLTAPNSAYTATIDGFSSKELTIQTTHFTSAKHDHHDVTMREFMITITDDGPGINPDMLETLFLPYLTTKLGDVRKGRGTGLGLAICKDIVELHGGTLKCVSIVGEGSSFILTVPLEVLNPSLSNSFGNMNNNSINNGGMSVSSGTTTNCNSPLPSSFSSTSLLDLSNRSERSINNGRGNNSETKSNSSSNRNSGRFTYNNFINTGHHNNRREISINSNAQHHLAPFSPSSTTSTTESSSSPSFPSISSPLLLVGGEGRGSNNNNNNNIVDDDYNTTSYSVQVTETSISSSPSRRPSQQQSQLYSPSNKYKSTANMNKSNHNNYSIKRDNNSNNNRPSLESSILSTTRAIAMSATSSSLKSTDINRLQQAQWIITDRNSLCSENAQLFDNVSESDKHKERQQQQQQQQLDEQNRNINNEEYEHDGDKDLNDDDNISNIDHNNKHHHNADNGDTHSDLSSFGNSSRYNSQKQDWPLDNSNIASTRSYTPINTTITTASIAIVTSSSPLSPHHHQQHCSSPHSPLLKQQQYQQQQSRSSPTNTSTIAVSLSAKKEWKSELRSSLSPSKWSSNGGNSKNKSTSSATNATSSTTAVKKTTSFSDVVDFTSKNNNLLSTTNTATGGNADRSVLTNTSVTTPSTVAGISRSFIDVTNGGGGMSVFSEVTTLETLGAAVTTVAAVNRSSSRGAAITKSRISSTTHHTKTRVLVVDDVLSNRKLLSMLLRKRGSEVTMAEDGVEALKSLETAGDIDYFDLVFMDNTIPNMTGIKCVKNMRRMGFTNIIIGLTGNTLEEELIEFGVAGTDLVLMKPLRADALDTLLQYLQSNGGFKSKLKEQIKLQYDSTSKTIHWSRSAYLNHHQDLFETSGGGGGGDSNNSNNNIGSSLSSKRNSSSSPHRQRRIQEYSMYANNNNSTNNSNNAYSTFNNKSPTSSGKSGGSGGGNFFTSFIQRKKISLPQFHIASAAVPVTLSASSPSPILQSSSSTTKGMTIDTRENKNKSV